MTDTQFLKAYTIKEVSKKINVPSGTIRQWEKDLPGLLNIPRTKQGARFYTDIEIELLLKIKQMRDKNLSKEMIRDLLDSYIDKGPLQGVKYPGTRANGLSSEPFSLLDTVSNPREDNGAFMAAMELYKDTLIEEVRTEIRNGIRKEVLEEVKKEISKGAFMTVKTISDSIYKSGERTSEQIRELSNTIDRTKEEKLENSVEHLSSGTNKEIALLAERLNDTKETVSEEFKILADYVSNNSETTNQELANLNEIINQERDYYLRTIKSEREEFRSEIRQRDEMFKEMVESFRETASSKNNKQNWWKLWK